MPAASILLLGLVQQMSSTSNLERRGAAWHFYRKAGQQAPSYHPLHHNANQTKNDCFCKDTTLTPRIRGVA